MTDIAAIDRLIDAVDSGKIYLRDSEKWEKTGIEKYSYLIVNAFYGSLDAAKALHDALLPGWGWDVASSDASAVFCGNELYGPAELAASQTPARAWLIAVLKAYRSVAK